jgi:two-component system response regulator PilR (NtrC family)
MSHKILVIDDEPDIRQLLSITLSRMGLSSYCVENLSRAKAALKEHEFSLCLSDLKLPDGSGLEFVKQVQESHPKLPVIVITAHGSMDIAITAMKYGAFDFINKPVDLHYLRTLINSALSSVPLAQESNESVPEIIGESPETLVLKEKIIKVSRSQAPIFIFGESGSGKELVARAIHDHSSRKEQPFIAVNCGAIPKELMESEFFGHTKGSFTGATHDKQGLFQAANGGTLLLDEIADLPLDMQVKLLRAIQQKMIRPIGASSEQAIDVRILSATHQNLSHAIEKGTFRSDLFYRINVIDINVPPLRKRTEDLKLLSQFILQKIALQNDMTSYQISDDAIQLLGTYHFPGNIRELENILERACALAEGNKINIDNLLFSEQVLAHLSESPQEKGLHNSETHRINHQDHGRQITYDSQQQSLDDYLESIEKELLLKALEKNRWNRTATAKELQISFRSLRYRLKKLAIDVDNTP